MKLLRADFLLVDNKLTALGFTLLDKQTIYMVLAAILNLGNIDFEENNNDGCFIRTESLKFLCSIAALLKIDESELKDALICHTRVVGNQQIK